MGAIILVLLASKPLAVLVGKQTIEVLEYWHKFNHASRMWASSHKTGRYSKGVQASTLNKCAI
jgi:hypothetical protein